MIADLLSISDMGVKIVAGLSGVILGVVILVIFIIRSNKKK